MIYYILLILQRLSDIEIVVTVCKYLKIIIPQRGKIYKNAA